MIPFTVLTDTPARLRNFLISRGVIVEEVVDGKTVYRGTLPGMEWVEVPNPIITDNSDPDNPVHDTRRVFLVQFSQESAEDEGVPTRVTNPETGLSRKASPFEWSRFGKWVKNNSTVVTAPANYTINGEPVGDAYKVNGENVWLVRDRPERFGGWQ